MTRWANAPNEAGAANVSIAMVTMCDVDLASGILYLHDGLGELAFGGHTYRGLGQYGTIDAVSEDLQNTAKSLQVKLSGVDPTLVSSAMTEDYQGRKLTIYIGLLDINKLSWIANPEVVWEGRMDYMSIDITQGSSVITMYCESRLYREPRVARYTDQDQQLAHPGDTFLNLIWQIPLASANWGATNVIHPAHSSR